MPATGWSDVRLLYLGAALLVAGAFLVALIAGRRRFAQLPEEVES